MGASSIRTTATTPPAPQQMLKKIKYLNKSQVTVLTTQSTQYTDYTASESFVMRFLRLKPHQQGGKHKDIFVQKILRHASVELKPSCQLKSIKMFEI
jgi:hypothetical protein